MATSKRKSMGRLLDTVYDTLFRAYVDVVSGVLPDSLSAREKEALVSFSDASHLRAENAAPYGQRWIIQRVESLLSGEVKNLFHYDLQSGKCSINYERATNSSTWVSKEIVETIEFRWRTYLHSNQNILESLEAVDPCLKGACVFYNLQKSYKEQRPISTGVWYRLSESCLLNVLSAKNTSIECLYIKDLIEADVYPHAQYGGSDAGGMYIFENNEAEKDSLTSPTILRKGTKEETSAASQLEAFHACYVDALLENGLPQHKAKELDQLVSCIIPFSRRPHQGNSTDSAFNGNEKDSEHNQEGTQEERLRNLMDHIPVSGSDSTAGALHLSPDILFRIRVAPGGYAICLPFAPSSRHQAKNTDKEGGNSRLAAHHSYQWTQRPSLPRSSYYMEQWCDRLVDMWNSMSSPSCSKGIKRTKKTSSKRSKASSVAGTNGKKAKKNSESREEEEEEQKKRTDITSQEEHPFVQQHEEIQEYYRRWWDYHPDQPTYNPYLPDNPWVLKETNDYLRGWYERNPDYTVYDWTVWDIPHPSEFPDLEDSDCDPFASNDDTVGSSSIFGEEYFNVLDKIVAQQNISPGGSEEENKEDSHGHKENDENKREKENYARDVTATSNPSSEVGTPPFFDFPASYGESLPC